MATSEYPTPLDAFFANDEPGYEPNPLTLMAYPERREPRYFPDGSQNWGTLPPEPVVLDMNLLSFTGPTGRYHEHADGTREMLSEVALLDGTQYLIDGEGLALVRAACPDEEWEDADG